MAVLLLDVYNILSFYKIAMINDTFIVIVIDVCNTVHIYAERMDTMTAYYELMQIVMHSCQ